MLNVTWLGDLAVLWLDTRLDCKRDAAPIELVHAWDLIARAVQATHPAGRAEFPAIREQAVPDACMAEVILPACEEHSYRNDPNQMSLAFF